MGARPHVVAGLALVAALALAPIAARAAAVDLSVDGELGGGVDSNPARVLGAPGTADAFLSALARARLDAAGDRFSASAQLAEAGRLYATVGEATAAGSRLDASARYVLVDGLSAGLALLASDLTERGHRLDQDALDAVASLAWTAAGWRLYGGAGWTLFAPRDAPLRPFLASGPRAVLGVDREIAHGERLALGYDVAAPAYPRWRELAGADRGDWTHTLSAELVHRGAFIAAVGYAYTWNRSSAAGGAFERHRVHGRVAAYVVGDLAVAARLSLQWSSYPDPLYLAQQLLLSEGQQNLDALEARVTYPLRGRLELAAALALYRAEAAVAPGDVPSFTRAVATLGLAWGHQGP